MKKKGLIYLLCLAVLCILMTSVSVSAATPKLNKKKISVRVTKSYKLKVKGAKGKRIKWSSSNKKIAKVSKKGVVKGIKKGTCKIYAKVGKKKLVCKVTVKPFLNKYLKRALKEQIGSVYYVNAREIPDDIFWELDWPTRYPKDNMDPVNYDILKWKSSNPKIASVDSYGEIHPKKAGKVTITVMAMKGDNDDAGYQGYAKKKIRIVDIGKYYKKVKPTKANFLQYFDIVKLKKDAYRETDAFGDVTSEYMLYRFKDKQLTKGWCVCDTQDFAVELEFKYEKPDEMGDYTETITIEDSSGFPLRYTISTYNLSTLKSVTVKRITGSLIYVSNKIRANKPKKWHEFYKYDFLINGDGPVV